MKKTFLELAIVWEKVTPESAENGDIDSHGYVIDGTEWELEECHSVETKEKISAHDALRMIESYGAREVQWHGKTVSFYSEDGVRDYCSDFETRYSLHISGDARLIESLVRQAK